MPRAFDSGSIVASVPADFLRLGSSRRDPQEVPVTDAADIEALAFSNFPIPVLRYVPEDGGEPLTIAPHKARHFDIQPLSFTQLVQIADGSLSRFPVVVKNGSAPTAITGLEKEGPLTITMSMEQSGEVLAYGLVDGGWLPHHGRSGI